MFKKKLVISTVLLVLVLCVGLTVYSETVKPIGIIENIKRALGEIMQSSNSDVQNITTIDVTGIELGRETEHEHVYKTMSDEEKHWEECIVCGEKQDEIGHQYIDIGWTNGTEANCKENNVHKFICNCGYSYITTVDRKRHNPGSVVYDKRCYMCYSICKTCGTALESHYCQDSEGNRIGCNNLKKCAICGNTATFLTHYVNDQITDKNAILKCKFCTSESCIIKVNYNYIEKISDRIFKCYTSITVPENSSFYTINTTSTGPFGNSVSINVNRKSDINNANTWNYETTITLEEYTEISGNVGFCTVANMNGQEVWIWLYSPLLVIDTIEPIITNIYNEENSLAEWGKNKRIIISGIENYCNTVKIEILDDKEKIICSGETNVIDGSYSISFIPELEAALEGRTFKAMVTDACENSTEQEFTISKIDAIPPEATSSAEIGGDWAKEKGFTAIASDYGIGNLQIAFNDVSDYQLASKNGTEYTREYKLVGDVYTPRKAMVFYKDELNNISSQEITIDKIDNTAPTIIGSRFDNNKLIIEANDIKEGMGEGSGVAKYRFITSNTRYENPVVSNVDSIEVNVGEEMVIPNIANVKYVYAVAEDNVGNVSEPYEIEVPHLDLRTEVNLSAANGKGTVELDWSKFELEDMYYVVYRRERSETEWTKIVSLEDKLTAKKYTDNLGNDKAKPSVPTINITGNSSSNSIDISLTATDNGTNYIYYVECYDVITNTVISSSK